MRFKSILGKSKEVDFETAVLNGIAEDGGLYVPDILPEITLEQLKNWQGLNYTQLANKLLRLLIPEDAVPSTDLAGLVDTSFAAFYDNEVIPFTTLNDGLIVQELFHGPTLSFKDVAMGFVVNLFDYFLTRRQETRTIIVATSGDTGPAAAHASVGKSGLSTWLLFPSGMISGEQRRQMSTLSDSQVHTVQVQNCSNGSDDLDEIIASLFAKKQFKEEVGLSSVNSINWARVMTQTVHYFYAYLQNTRRIGEPINFSVPCGAFGNLCAGTLAKRMGLPVGNFIAASNNNGVITKVMSDGVLQKKKVEETHANAIDIAVPMNFWRYLYFTLDESSQRINKLFNTYQEEGNVSFNSDEMDRIRSGFTAITVSDDQILSEIRNTFNEDEYLLDPHGAVAVSAARTSGFDGPVVCLATAHPAKFSQAILQALGRIPDQGLHFSIEKNKLKEEHLISVEHSVALKRIPEIIIKN